MKECKGKFNFFKYRFVHRSPFVIPGEDEDKAHSQRAKRELAGDSFSDHIGLSRAVEVLDSKKYSEL